MTGPEHYKEAERLTGLGHDLMDQGHRRRAEFILQRAQVHATLALVAATANQQVSSDGHTLSLAEPPGEYDNRRPGDNPTWGSVLS